MKRKIISLILTLAMTLTFVSSLAVSAAGEGTVKFVASNESVSRGDTLSYAVSLSDMSAIRGIQAGITFDETKAEVVSYSFCDSIEDDAYAADFKEQNGLIGFALSYEDAVVLDGDIAVIEFRILDSAVSGAAGFGLSANGVEVIDESGADLETNILFDNVSINYDYSATLSAETTSEIVYNNSEVVYELSLSELSAMRGLSMSLLYDSDIFTLISAEAKGVLEEGTYTDTVVDTTEEGVINVAAEYADVVDIEGNIMTLTFKVNKDKEAKEYTPLSLKSFEFVTSESEIADLNLEMEVDSIIISRASFIEISYKADKEEVNRGETVKYTVTLDDIATSRGFQSKMLYDASQLKLINVEKGKILSDAGRVSGINSDTPGEISFVCAYEEELLETGEIAVLEFEVMSDAKDGYINIDALDSFAVDASYDFIDAESINNVDNVYIGRKGRQYELKLSTDAKVYADGDVVNLAVSMGEIDKFLGVQFAIEYDPANFEYIKPTKKSAYYGSVMKEATAKSINDTKTTNGKVEVLVGFGSADMYSGLGDICTLAFTAKADVSGYADFTVTKIVPKDGDSVLGSTVKPYILSADSDALKVVDYINEIGTIESGDESIIVKARNLYDGLLDIEKLYIKNYSTLVVAEEVLAVVKAIDAIGVVNAGSKPAIDAARAAYENLSETSKVLVSNYALLKSSEAKYEELRPVYSYTYAEVGKDIVVTVTNNKGSDTPLLITAQYGANGALLSVEIETVNLAVGKTAEYTYAKNSNTATVKCMLWNDMVTISPYNN